MRTFTTPRVRRAICCALFALFGSTFLVGSGLVVRATEGSSVSGVVRDSSGGAITDATVTLATANHAVIKTTKSDAQGGFTFSGVPSGRYIVIVSSRGFDDRRHALTVGSDPIDNLELIIGLRPFNEEVTVTANPGVVETVERLSQEVNVIGEQQIEERAASVTAEVANEEVGVHLQRTSPTIAGIFVRGLTGNKVNVFVDGVRYSTSAMRGGISSFLDLIDQSNLKTVEILRGPNSAQYGSDAIGGSVQFLTLSPSFATDRPEVRGRLSSSFNSADAGFGSSLTTSFATRKLALLTNFTGRRVNTLRTGHERDSHNAVTRFFGLSSDIVLGDRTPDTAFTQYGGLMKLSYAPRPLSQITLSYARSQQDGGKRYDQLLGGDGNLIADLRNFMLDFAYARYDKVKLGWFDTFTAIYSFNSQREERVNQGGNGNPNASINHEFERTNAHGVQAFAGKQWGSRNNVLLGGEFYHERIQAPSFGFNPVTRVSTLRRPRVPGNSRYNSGGLYLQDIVEAIPNRLRLVGNVRWSAASYQARAADSPLAAGKPLWPDDSLKVDDVTFRAGAIFTPIEGVSLSANISRGFRAPHITDLGTLGLTGSGFEVAAPDVAGLGATIGSSADGAAVSTGTPVKQVAPETSITYEMSARYHKNRFDTDLTFFVNDISDNITKQALLLPAGSVGKLLGTTPITSQSANGVVFVAASTGPVLVRANFDDVRIYGFEHTLDAKLAPEWSIGTIFTYLHARDKQTDLPPNIEGGTPAPDGYVKLRYASASRRFWIEPYIHAADRQDRLSSLDLEDRRTGATRSRGSIASFFNNGARFRGLVSAGPDGIPGNADDRLIVTGETLAEIQNRVLGARVNAAPLYTSIAGYATFNVRGGLRFGERHEILIDFRNINDRNYRGISWGLDAPGRGLFLKYNLRF